MACYSSVLSLFKIDIDASKGTWLELALAAAIVNTWWLGLWVVSSGTQVWGVVLLALLGHVHIATTCCHLLFLPHLVLVHGVHYMLSTILVLLQGWGLIACTVIRLTPRYRWSVGTVSLSLLAGPELVVKLDALFFELLLELLDALNLALYLTLVDHWQSLGLGLLLASG